MKSIPAFAAVFAAAVSLAAAARAAARAILDAPPFVTPRRSPGFFDHVAGNVGHWITGVVRWLLHQLDRIIAHPVSSGAHAIFGSWAPVVLAAAGALVLAAVVTVLVLRHQRANPATEGGDVPADPAARRAARAARLLDEATAAWHDGDLDGALRLRFAAGLERLEARGLLRERASLTTATLASTLSSRTFDELASVHTLVAYAGATATPEDVERAFARWPRVADEARAAVGAR